MGLSSFDGMAEGENASRGALGRVNKEHHAIGNTVSTDVNAKFEAIMAKSFGELVTA